MRKWHAVGSALLVIGLLGACSNQSDDTTGNEINAEQPVQQNDDMTKEHNTKDASEKADNQINENSSDNKTASLSQSEVIQAIKKQLDTELDIMLPKQLPVENGHHLTATTTSAADQYEVTFFSSKEPIPINHKSLNQENNNAKRIAVLKIKKYPNRDKANQAIAFQDYSTIGGNKVDLGYGITGYQDAGTGHVWTNWNEGRWALSTQATTKNSDNGVKLSKESVAF